MKITVFLLKNVPNFGKAGETKQVPAGYYKNHLFPAGFAVLLTDNLKNKLEQERMRLQKQGIDESQTAQKNKEVLEGLTLIFPMKQNAGAIFGSITRHEIWEKLRQTIKDIEKDAIKLGKPIKGMGDHEVEVSLGYQVVAKLKISVINEDVAASEIFVK